MTCLLQQFSAATDRAFESTRRSKRLMISVVTMLALVGFFPSPALAQASLAAEDLIDEVEVAVDGTKETYTVIRDAVRRDQWYYMPKTVRLYERTVQKKNEPEFALLRHQYEDPAAPGGKVEVGSLVFAVTLGAPEGVQTDL